MLQPRPTLHQHQTQIRLILHKLFWTFDFRYGSYFCESCCLLHHYNYHYAICIKPRNWWARKVKHSLFSQIMFPSIILVRISSVYDVLLRGDFRKNWLCYDIYQISADPHYDMIVLILQQYCLVAFPCHFIKIETCLCFMQKCILNIIFHSIFYYALSWNKVQLKQLQINFSLHDIIWFQLQVDFFPSSCLCFWKSNNSLKLL